MQAREIRTWTVEELEERLSESYRMLFAMRRDRVSGRLEDFSRIKIVKRDIARMKTILRERELGAELIEGGEVQ